MFTGIIEAVGTVKAVEKSGVSGKIEVAAPLDLSSVKLGDSICVSGACLTVVAISAGGFSADVSEETFALTTLGELKPGHSVNLELSLTPTKPMGGHIVTGHIDGTGELVKRERRGSCEEIEFKLPASLLAQLVKKGSVAVDGISLTVADLTDTGFTVAVIPHTLKGSTLGEKSARSRVNIETDIIGKYVERFLGPHKKGGITESLLRDNGFLR